MSEPSGKIVAKPIVVRSCGHSQEFQHYEVDRFRAQRLLKFQRSRCADCVAKLNEEQQRAAQANPTKGEVLKSLPAGTKVTLVLQPDGSWLGTLTASGTTVEMTGMAEAGPQSVVVALARKWQTISKSGAEKGAN